jgi:hypothetical protein
VAHARRYVHEPPGEAAGGRTGTAFEDGLGRPMKLLRQRARQSARRALVAAHGFDQELSVHAQQLAVRRRYRIERGPGIYGSGPSHKVAGKRDADDDLGTVVGDRHQLEDPVSEEVDSPRTAPRDVETLTAGQAARNRAI